MQQDMPSRCRRHQRSCGRGSEAEAASALGYSTVGVARDAAGSRFPDTLHPGNVRWARPTTTLESLLPAAKSLSTESFVWSRFNIALPPARACFSGSNKVRRPQTRTVGTGHIVGCQFPGGPKHETEPLVGKQGSGKHRNEVPQISQGAQLSRICSDRPSGCRGVGPAGRKLHHPLHLFDPDSMMMVRQI